MLIQLGLVLLAAGSALAQRRLGMAPPPVGVSAETFSACGMAQIKWENGMQPFTLLATPESGEPATLAEPWFAGSYPFFVSFAPGTNVTFTVKDFPGRRASWTQVVQPGNYSDCYGENAELARRIAQQAVRESYSINGVRV